MSELKVGIIGIGNMGSAHAKMIYNNEIEGMKLVAVCDLSNKKIEWAKENLAGVEIFTDYEQLIKSKKVDTIIVAAPHYLHPEISICGLENDLNVLCEKPIGVYTKAVEKMNEAADKTDKKFGIVFNQRTVPTYAKAKELVKTGQLGNLQRINWIITNWYRSQGYYDSGSWRATWAGEGGGVLLNQAPHNIDLWQWICGMPKTIVGFASVGKFHNIEVEDDVTIYAEYDNGATAVFITTTGEAPGTNRLEIIGDKGKIVIDGDSMKWWKLEVSLKEHTKTAGDFEQPNSEFIEFKDMGQPTMHKGILQNFANAVLKGEKLIADGREGINSLTISNAAYLSSWKDNIKINLPIDADEFYAYLEKRIASSKVKPQKDSEISNLQGSISERWKVKF